MWRLEGVRTRTLREVFPKNMETFKGIFHEGGVSRAINVFSSSIFTSFTTEGVLTILTSLSLLDKPHLGQSSNVRGGKDMIGKQWKLQTRDSQRALRSPRSILAWADWAPFAPDVTSFAPDVTPFAPELTAPPPAELTADPFWCNAAGVVVISMMSPAWLVGGGVNSRWTPTSKLMK